MSYSVLEIGEEFATLTRPGHSEGVTARILHREVGSDGYVKTLILDRRIHERYTRIDGWSATGYVATELERTRSD